MGQCWFGLSRESLLIAGCLCPCYARIIQTVVSAAEGASGAGVNPVSPTHTESVEGSSKTRVLTGSRSRLPRSAISFVGSQRLVRNTVAGKAGHSVGPGRSVAESGLMRLETAKKDAANSVPGSKPSNLGTVRSNRTRPLRKPGTSIRPPAVCMRQDGRHEVLFRNPGTRPLRLAAKDVALSRQWRGFESRRGYAR